METGWVMHFETSLPVYQTVQRGIPQKLRLHMSGCSLLVTLYCGDVFPRIWSQTPFSSTALLTNFSPIAPYTATL